MKSKNFLFKSKNWFSLKDERTKRKIVGEWLKPFLFLLPLLILIILFVVYPLINSIGDSFKIFGRYNKVDYTLGINNFHDLVDDKNFNHAFYNSNMITIIGGVMGLLGGLFFGYLLNSIKFKLFKKITSVILFSQFFISSWAIGLSFIFLFEADKNLFNLLFKTRINFTGKDSGFNNVWVMIAFHIWRVIPFNIVIFLFGFTNVDEKYYKLNKVEKLSLKDRLLYLYWPSLQKTFLLVIYINFLEAILLNPLAIFHEHTINNNKNWTISYYVYYNLKLLIQPNFERASAATVVTLSYILLIFIVIFLIKFLATSPKIKWKFYKKWK